MDGDVGRNRLMRSVGGLYMSTIVRAFFYSGLWLCSVLVLTYFPFRLSFAQVQKTVTQTEIEKVANQSEVQITTIGRKSGKLHTKPIWFVYDHGHFYIQSGKEGKSDWYKNLKKNPELKLKIGDFTGMTCLALVLLCFQLGMIFHQSLVLFQKILVSKEFISNSNNSCQNKCH